MPIDPTDILGQLERAIGLMPAAFLVIVMLAGPTVAWLLYRFVVQPRTRRYADTSLDVFWICEQCRSANDVHVSQCYSCGLERDVTMAGGVRVLDAGGALLLAPEVGEAPQPAASPAATAPVPAAPVPAGPVPGPALAVQPPPLVAVGPGAAPAIGAAPATSAPPATKRSRRAPVPVMDPEAVVAPAVGAASAPPSRRRASKVPAATPPGPEPGA